VPDGGVVVVVVGGAVVVVVPLPATALVGAAEGAGEATVTTARTAPVDPVGSLARPAVPADELDVPVGAAGTLAWDGTCAGVGKNLGTSPGPGPENSAEMRGWMIGPGPTTRPATTVAAAATAAAEAMKGLRGRKPGRTDPITAAVTGTAAAATLASGFPKFRDSKTSSSVASPSTLAGSGFVPSIVPPPGVVNWRG
jgi:hypothetical protein